MDVADPDTTADMYSLSVAVPFDLTKSYLPRSLLPMVCISMNAPILLQKDINLCKILSLPSQLRILDTTNSIGTALTTLELVLELPVD